MVPKRFEIEPSCIAGNLPDTFILERVAQSTLRFRLAGTRISEMFGIDFRGVNLFQLFDEADVKILQRQVQLSVSNGAVSVFKISASSETGLSNDFELLLLPLSHTREAVDRFLGSIAPVGKPHWLGTVALTRNKLVGHETNLAGWRGCHASPSAPAPGRKRGQNRPVGAAAVPRLRRRSRSPKQRISRKFNRL